MTAAVAEPFVALNGRPQPGSTKQDAEYALHRATAYRRRGGDWNQALQAYVNAWLDHLALLATPEHELVANLDAGLLAVAPSPGGSPAEDGG